MKLSFTILKSHFNLSIQLHCYAIISTTYFLRFRLLLLSRVYFPQPSRSTYLLTIWNKDVLLKVVVNLDDLYDLKMFCEFLIFVNKLKNRLFWNNTFCNGMSCSEKLSSGSRKTVQNNSSTTVYFVTINSSETIDFVTFFGPGW